MKRIFRSQKIINLLAFLMIMCLLFTMVGTVIIDNSIYVKAENAEASDSQNADKNEESGNTENEEASDSQNAISGISEKQENLVFEINTVDDFIDFSINCRKNSWSKDRIVSLNADLSLEGIIFDGISSFSGTFKGNGHTIENLSITSGDEAIGLFRYLERDGVIEDLIVDGAVQSSDSRDIVGGIVGVNAGTIIGCQYNGQIRVLSVAGGIVGLNGGTGNIIECVNNGFITSQTNVGGIAGINRGQIMDSVNMGNINSDSSWVDGTENESTEISIIDSIDTILESGKNIGGIAGWSNGAIATCTNRGVVGYLRTGENVGGIVGCTSGNVFYCKNLGKVYGKQDVGGIAGQFEPTIVIKGIREIKDEVDTLHDVLDKSTNDMDKATDNLTDDLNNINTNTDKITDFADKVTDEGLDIIESDTDVANDFSDRADYVTKHLEPINKYMGNALDDIDSLNAVLDKIENEVDMSQADKDKLRKSRENIDKKTKDLTEVSKSASEYTDNISGIVTDSKDAPEGSREYLSNHKDELIDNLSGMLDKLTDALVIATDIMGDVNDISSVVMPYIDETNEAVSKDLDEANKLAQNMVDNVQDANDGTGAILSYLNSQDKLEIMNFSDNFDKNVESLQKEVDSTIESMNKLNENAATNTDLLEEDLRNINDQMQKVSDLVMDRLENMESFAEGEDIIVDASDKDPKGELCANITGCVNEGNIDGNTNIGGITGSIGIDSLDDNNKGLGTKYEVAAVLLNSNNKGFVTFKNKNAGGIVGNVTAGYMEGCTSLGGIFTEEGNYLGGIAGYSSGTIVSCNSLSVLSGNEYIGGIAGSADDVHGCLAMNTIINSNGRIGAIMGAYKSDTDDITVYHQGMSEHIYDNYFVSNDLYGIDNVSYTGVAEPIDYDEMISKSSEFKQLKLYFVDEDYLPIDQMEYRYGADLTELHYPDITTDDGKYVEWEQVKDTQIISNLVVRSKIVDNVTILSSEYKLDGKAFALAEGVFTKEAKLQIVDLSSGEGSLPGGIPANAVVNKYAISIINGHANPNVDENTSGEYYNIRLLQANEGKVTLYGYVDDSWQKLDAKNIGSYYQLTMPGNELTICMVTQPKSNMIVIYLVAAGVIAVIVALLLIIKKVKRK